MRSAPELLAQQYLEMRNRLLSLAADLDRIHRAPGGPQTLASDPRAADLRRCADILFSADRPDRATRVQLLLSDHTPPPER